MFIFTVVQKGLSKRLFNMFGYEVEVDVFGNTIFIFSQYSIINRCKNKNIELSIGKYDVQGYLMNFTIYWLILKRSNKVFSSMLELIKV